MEPIHPFRAEIDSVRRLGAAFADQVEQVADDHWGRSTPCRGWAVRDLVAHVASIVGGLEALATGAPLPPAIPAAEVSSGFHTAARMRQDLATGVRAWRLEHLASYRDFPWGRTPAVRALQFTAVELAGHGWDLMVAIGAAPSFCDHDLEAVIVTATHLIPQVARSGLFDPPASVPTTAPVIDRMAAATGRPVTIPSQT